MIAPAGSLFAKPCIFMAMAPPRSACSFAFGSAYNCPATTDESFPSLFEFSGATTPPPVSMQKQSGLSTIFGFSSHPRYDLFGGVD